MARAARADVDAGSTFKLHCGNMCYLQLQNTVISKGKGSVGFGLRAANFETLRYLIWPYRPSKGGEEESRDKSHAIPSWKVAPG